MKKIIVTGIGTDIGKTLVAAILTEHLNADYWKPVQSGDLQLSDTMKVRGLLTNTTSYFHKERYRLNQPLSPHAAAKIDGVRIAIGDFQLPETTNHLIIEGAGGLMVPLNDKDLLIDLIEKLGVGVVLVSQNYLGSINHTLLSIQELKRRNIPVLGIVFNGVPNHETESFIVNYSKLPVLLRIDLEPNIDKQTVLKYAKKIRL